MISSSNSPVGPKSPYTAGAAYSITGIDQRYNRTFAVPVLFYNSDFLIIDKPFDVRIDGPTDSSPTIEALLTMAFAQHAGQLRLVHQLDCCTSGVHVWGLTKAAARNAGKLFEQRKVSKRYSALVVGHVKTDVFAIDAPIAHLPNDEKNRMCIGSTENPGRSARTDGRVVRRGYARFEGSERVQKATLVELKPESGRRHQLLPHIRDNCDSESVLVGHSSGAAAALRFAVANKLRGLVLVAAYDDAMGDDCEQYSGDFHGPFDWQKIQDNCGSIEVSYITHFERDDEQKKLRQKTRMSLFGLLSLTILTCEILVYLGSLINPSFLPAHQRRTMVKSLRNIGKLKEAQFAAIASGAVIGMLFLESTLAIVRIWNEFDERTFLERENPLYQLRVARAEKHFITSAFTMMMAIVVFMRLREKNNYVKLLEKYESKPEGEAPEAASKKDK
ncbi:putative hydrolase rbbp9 [Podochytrium sp. JEL0797]|nr:putative hydrolase rbbp9 [Podochytrium sp. JEL0797]